MILNKNKNKKSLAACGWICMSSQYRLIFKILVKFWSAILNSSSWCTALSSIWCILYTLNNLLNYSINSIVFYHLCIMYRLFSINIAAWCNIIIVKRLVFSHHDQFSSIPVSGPYRTDDRSSPGCSMTILSGVSGVCRTRGQTFITLQ